MYILSLITKKQLYGEKAHPDIAHSYNNLGTFYINQSNYNKAEEMLIMALNQRLELFGNNPHSDIAGSYNNLGGVYHDQGKYKEGEKYYLKALNIRKQIHGERAHPDVAISYKNLGTLYDSQEDYKRAEEMYIKSLNLNLELYGKDKPHADVSRSYNNLGFVYYNLGDYKRAEEYYKKDLNIDIEIHGEKDHPAVVPVQTLKAYPRRPVNHPKIDIVQNVIIEEEKLISNYSSKKYLRNKYLISASVDLTLKFWSEEFIRIEKDEKVESEYLKLLEIDDKYIIGGKKNGCLDVILSAPPYKKLFELTGHRGSIFAICSVFMEGKKYPHVFIATGGDDDVIGIWNLNLKRCEYVLKGGHTKAVSCLLQHSNGQLISGGLDSQAIIWDISTKQIITRIPHGENTQISGLIEQYDESMISYYYNNISLHFWSIYDHNSKDISANIPGLIGFNSSLKINQTIYLGGSDGRIYIYNLPRGEFMGNYYSHESSINQILELNQHEIITCSSDQMIKIFDIDELVISALLPTFHTGSVQDILLIQIKMEIFEEDELILAKTTIREDQVLFIIGGYKLPVLKEILFGIISPIFTQILGDEGDTIELPYYNADISFNEILFSYITEQKLEIKESSLAECIILSSYFPYIHTQCELYIQQNMEIINNSFAINNITETYLDSFDSSLKNSKFLQINKGHIFSTTKLNFIKTASKFICKNITIKTKDIRLIYLFSSKIVETCEFLFTRYANRIIDNSHFNSILKNIENYLSGKDIDIKENNYSFLLSFAYLCKLTHLRTLCDDWKKNNIAELSRGISNYIFRKYGIYNEYIYI